MRLFVSAQRAVRVGGALVAILFIGLLAASGVAEASGGRPQAKAKVEVGLSSGLIKFGDVTSLRITVETNRRGRGADLKFGALDAVEGLSFGKPQRGAANSYTSFDSRGQSVSRTKSVYLIPVVPERAGEFEILPITLEVDGERISRPLEPMQLKVVEDLAASEFLVFERSSTPDKVFEGEPFEVEFEWGWDTGVDAQTAMLRIPWYGRQEGVIELETFASGRTAEFYISRNQRIPVEDLGAVTRSGRSFRMFRMRRRFVATRPGKVEFTQSIFEFSSRPQSRRRNSRETFYRPLEPFSIAVEPVPEEGRPLGWTGAVGKIKASREALKRDVDAGDPVDFTLTYAGEGNLEFFAAPDLTRLPGFEDFRVLGVDDEKDAFERVIKYDLVPLDAAITEVPSVPLWVFNTETESFVELNTEPLEIRVRSVESADGEDPFGAATEEEALPPIVMRDIVPRPAVESGAWLQRGTGALVPFLFLIFGVVGWRGLRRLVHTREDPASAEARRRRGALRKMERELRQAGGDPGAQARALEAFLGARTGTAPEAWIGTNADDLRRAAAPHGEPSAGLMEQYAAIRTDLDAALFRGAGKTGGIDPERLRAFAKGACSEGLR